MKQYNFPRYKSFTDEGTQLPSILENVSITAILKIVSIKATEFSSQFGGKNWGRWGKKSGPIVILAFLVSFALQKKIICLYVCEKSSILLIINKQSIGKAIFYLSTIQKLELKTKKQDRLMKESELKTDRHNRPIQKSELDINRLYTIGRLNRYRKTDIHRLQVLKAILLIIPGQWAGTRDGGSQVLGRRFRGWPQAIISATTYVPYRSIKRPRTFFILFCC